MINMLQNELLRSCHDKKEPAFFTSYFSKGERLWLVMWKVVLSISESLPWLSK